MQINYNLSGNNSFKSLRQDKKFVEQLTKDNKYTFAENNQRRILESIENIGKKGSEKNVKFLLNVAKNIRYATNIKFNFSPKNQWLNALMAATSTAITVAGLDNSIELKQEYDEVFAIDKPLTEEETQILGKYDSIVNTLSKMTDKKTLEPINNNLQYFIISSESSLEDKKYILDRLEFFLSDEYQLNEQIQDKKVQVFSEIINDIALDKVNSDTPNIKAINQQTHGVCASISIARKLMAYEYKRNYVDCVMSELDNTDNLMVYDRTKLGRGIKIPVSKALIDYNKAINNGFRIVDASVANWMNYADMDMSNEDIGVMYTMYDEMNNGLYQDKHINILGKDTKIPNQFELHQALSISEERLKRLKSLILKHKYISESNGIQSQIKLAEEKKLYTDSLKGILENLLDNPHKEIAHDISVKIINNLQQDNSEKLNEKQDIAKDYLYIPNEEPSIKKRKIKAFLNDGYSYALKEPLNDKQVEGIFELIETIHSISSPQKPSQFAIANQAFEVTKAFKAQVLKACAIPERLTNYMVNLEFGDEDERFLENIDYLITRVAGGDKQIIEGLSKNLELDTPDKSEVMTFLISAEDYLKSLPTVYDEFYKRMNMKNRYNALIEEVKNGKEILASNEDEKINKLMSITGIYSETKLGEVFDEIEDLLTHKTIIETFSQMFDCPAKKEQVLAYVNAVIKGLTTHNDEQMTEDIANNLEIPADAVIPTLINVSMGLSGKKDNEIYKIAAKKINQFSIKQDFFQYHSALIHRFSQGIEKEFVEELLVNNGYPKEISVDNLNDLMAKLLQDIQNMAVTINTIAEKVHIMTDEGDIINSVYPPAIILNEYEKRGFVAKQADINKFNKRLEQLNILNANRDKYSPQEYKRISREIKKLSSREKEIVNNILKHTNEMYKETSREKQFLFSAIAKGAEETYRDYGVNTTGEFWNSLTPHSGLGSTQQQAILEAMTDKQHYIEKDIEDGVDKIKGGYQSGISSTSVSDNTTAWHAQYVSSIEPVKVPSKTNDKILVEKDILFHDNTWGVGEKENTWTDSRGMLRTDYSSDYGYKYGYITNSELKNGTFVNDLLTKVGKISNDNSIDRRAWKKLNPSSEFSFPLIHDFVLPGKDTKALDIAKQIRDSILINEDRLVNILEKEASNMTPEQLKHKLKVLNKIGMSCFETFNNYEKRIKGNSYDKGIETEDDYKNLANDDKLKIMLEKAALRETYSDIAFDEKISKLNSLEEITELENILKNKIREKFYYTFGKRSELTKYLLSEKNRDLIIEDVIKPELENENITLSPENIKVLLAKKTILEEVDAIGHDGSIRSLTKAFQTVIINRLNAIFPEQLSKETINNIAEDLFIYIISELRIDEDDINEEEIPEFITNWIDKNFDIQTNEDFIKVFNKLQNYTLEEFEEKVMKNISDEDLNINKTTGFEILQKIRNENDDASDMLLNEVFFEEFDNVYEQSINKPYTRYNKFDSKITGMYPVKTSFDEAYMLVRMGILKLTYKKAFDSVKTDAYKQYNVLPAYPHLKALEEEGADETTTSQLAIIKKTFNSLNNLISQIKCFELISEIKDLYIENKEKALSLEDIKTLSDKIDALKKVTAPNDKIFHTQLEKLSEIKNLEAGASLKEFEDTIEKLEQTKEALIKLCSLEEYETKIAETQKALTHGIDIFLEIKVGEKHRTKIRTQINEWLRAVRYNLDNTEQLYEKIVATTERYGAIQKPVETLDAFLIAASEKRPDISKTTVPALKSTVLGLLRNSRFLVTQEVIMKATRDGLTNAIANEFPNIDVTLYKTDINNKHEDEIEESKDFEEEENTYDEDGGIGNIEIKQMSSPETLQILVRSLILEDNYEHFKNFVEKFNLQQKVVPIMCNAQEFEIASKALDKFRTTKDNLVKEKNLIKALDERIKALPQLNTEEFLEETENIANFLKNSDYAKEDNYFIDNIISTFEDIKNARDIEALASLETSATLMELVDSVLTECYGPLISKLKEFEDIMFNMGLIANSLDSLNLDLHPELAETRNNALDKYGEILETQNNIMKEINNLKLFG